MCVCEFEKVTHNAKMKTIIYYYSEEMFSEANISFTIDVNKMINYFINLILIIEMNMMNVF